MKECSIEEANWEDLATDRGKWRTAVTCGYESWETQRVKDAVSKREVRKARQANPHSDTGQTDHKCLVCGRFFTARIGLVGHMRSHKK